jgi:hypothetical protein
MLRRATLMLTFAAMAVLVVAPSVESKTVTCKSGQVCKGTNAADWILAAREMTISVRWAATTMCLEMAGPMR